MKEEPKANSGLNTPLSRRSLLSTAGATAIAFPFVSTLKVLGANSRLNIACIGVGGKGVHDVDYCAKLGQNIVALCDVDEAQGGASFAKYPRATRHTDYRKMFDQSADSIDAVTISTPDHSHFQPAVRAMSEGKHVYVQKPLAHTVHEARALKQLSESNPTLVTQMGNQGHSDSNSRRLVELIRAGVLGDVSEIHAWTDRPGKYWKQGLTKSKYSQPIPSHLKWDLWLGPAPFRPYLEGCAPFKWRGWWDFGTGSLGDMGCHNLDMAYWALNLDTPHKIEPNASTYFKDSPPLSSEVTWHFNNPKPGGEPIKMKWYDGGRKPEPWVAGRKSITAPNGAIVVGSKDRLYIPYLWGKGYFMTSASMAGYANSIPYELPRISGGDQDPDLAHHHEWIDACLGNGKTMSHFGYASKLTETVLLGNVALQTRQSLEWDSEKMMVTNAPSANQLISKHYREDW